MFENIENHVSVSTYQDVMIMHWQTKGCGFGQFYFTYKDGQWYCDNELMSKKFIKERFAEFIDGVTLTCERSGSDGEGV